MKFKFRLLVPILVMILFSESDFLSAQTLNHEIFLKEIENSSDNIYYACIQKYDEYLEKHPDDLSVYIEKCKFIQLAQYDDEEEYNPNQEAFDSCAAALIKMFPENPDVFIFQTTYLWGDDLDELFLNAEKSIAEKPGTWSKSNLSTLYLKMADNYYYDSEYKKAHAYILKAISNDSVYLSSIEYARILIKLERPEDALHVLTREKDTTKILWQLSQKADLLLELKAYSNALDIYNQIDGIDSTYLDKSTLATTLEGLGQYDLARTYLVADTLGSWNKENAVLTLLIHDLKYKDGKKCYETYNQYRDFGYSMDPLGIYRLKLFFSHPFQPWRFRDLLSIFCLIAAFLVLIIVPSVWILPVYFAGHHWNMISRPKPFESSWGLKTFWFVSYGYLAASFLATIADPGYLYSLLNSSYYEINQESQGHISMIFMLTYAAFGIASLYRIKPRILLSTHWSIANSVFLGIGILLLYRLVVGIYVYMGVSGFGVSIEDLTDIPGLLLVSRLDIGALVASYGKFIAIILIGLLVPFYEEIIFRGVILESCMRYISFNAANVFQSFLFAAIHQSLFLFPLFFLFGIISGILRKKSGGLLSGIVFHAANNILVLSVLMLKGNILP